MSKNYIIAVGGTGSRCLESVIYLAAAGLFKEPLYVFIIDPDISNGNRNRTKELIENYHQLRLCKQPSTPKKGGKELPKPVSFQSSVNENEKQILQDCVWSGIGNSTFKNIIQYDNTDKNSQEFIKLFYTAGDLNMDLKEGYRGRTNVGAVAFKLALKNTVENDKGLENLISSIKTDIQNQDTRIFIMGSLFGGSGAAAIPNLPSFFRDIISSNYERLRFGCAMMIPYFSFPQGENENDPRSDRHLIATQAALYHYAQSPPDYNHVYLIGSPEQRQTSEINKSGGEKQENTAHYAEWTAALAALDFFSRKVEPADRALHYANAEKVQWDTLPLGSEIDKKKVKGDTLPLGGEVDKKKVRQQMISFTTFAFFYNKFLHGAFMNGEYLKSVWYKNNFKTGSLLIKDDAKNSTEMLGKLNNFAASFLEWLKHIGESGNTNMDKMFDWNKLSYNQISDCANVLGNLTENAKHPNDGYDRILKNMDALTLRTPETDSPTGLLIYLLHHAVHAFCQENYGWGSEITNTGTGLK